MQVNLLRITDDSLNFIGDCAGICYDSKRDRDSNIRRAVSCKDKGHLATLRFAHAVFHISGISRICSHQFVRSKHLDFLQRSQRYCKEVEAKFVLPTGNEEQTATMIDHFELCLDTYNKLIASGMKKEDARFVLPESTTTELIVTGNFQAWLDFVNLRMDKHAQWEIREVARQINNVLAQHAPGLFNWAPEITK